MLNPKSYKQQILFAQFDFQTFCFEKNEKKKKHTIEQRK